MMEWLQVIVLAIVQGLTEFLPISSTAHLILVPKITGWPDQGLSFDIAVHIGTLAAVLIYFKRDLLLMFQDSIKFITTREKTVHGHLSFQIMLATIPVGLAGLIFHDLVSTYMRSPLIIASCTILFGLFLLFSDKLSQPHNQTVNYKQALMIGLAQVLALIPGTSRSGVTLTAGLWLGLNRETAARFSFLLSIPVILLASALEIKKICESPDTQPWALWAVGAFIAFIFALLCIHCFLKMIKKIGVTPFVIYRFFLGLFLFYLFY